MPSLPKHDEIYASIPDVDWARLAAFIDGEGCIKLTTKNDSRRPGKTYYRFTIEICNTDPRLTQWLKLTFGGVVVFREMKVRRWKDAYTWIVTERRAESLLKKCLPFLIIKRGQADIALAYRATFDSHSHMSRDPKTGRVVTLDEYPAVHQARGAFIKQLSQLKVRGKASLETIQ